MTISSVAVSLHPEHAYPRAGSSVPGGTVEVDGRGQREAVLRLRRAGVGWSEIARRVGFSDPRIAALLGAAGERQEARELAAGDRVLQRWLRIVREEEVVGAQWEAAMVQGDRTATRAVLGAMSVAARLRRVDVDAEADAEPLPLPRRLRSDDVADRPERSDAHTHADADVPDRFGTPTDAVNEGMQS